MKCNVGGIDMAARLIVGAILLGIAFVVPMSTGWQIAVFVLAAIALLTGLLRYCPVNAMLGLNTCARQAEKHKAKEQQSPPGAQREPQQSHPRAKESHEPVK